MKKSDRPVVAVEPIAPGSGLELARRMGIGQRIAAIDMLRGVAVILMVLDHARVYFSSEPLYRDGAIATQTVAEMNPALFVFQWLTSWCGPIFVLLAGLGARLRLAAGGSKANLGWFLATRGLMLVALDLSIVPMLKWFYINPQFTAIGPLWAIGWSMVVLSGLVFLPLGVAAVFGLTVVVGHNLLDGIQADSLGAMRNVWIFLHEPGMVRVGDWLAIDVRWPLVPWVGVMACGYALGEIYRHPAQLRQTMLTGLGSNLIVTFLILRGFNLYGDPHAWSSLANVGRSLMSFLNVTGQPASFCFLLMTLGPSFVMLAWFEARRSPRLEKLAALGCVPLYCYVAHWLLLHVAATGVAVALGNPIGWLMARPDASTGRGVGWQENFGFSLAVTLLIGIVAVVVIYLSSRRYAALKFVRRPRWASYF